MFISWEGKVGVACILVLTAISSGLLVMVLFEDANI